MNPGSVGSRVASHSGTSLCREYAVLTAGGNHGTNHSPPHSICKCLGHIRVQFLVLSQAQTKVSYSRREGIVNQVNQTVE